MITAVLVWALVTLPLKADDGPSEPQNISLALCVAAAAGIAVVGIYIVAKKCKPKYFWLMDDDQPPKFWVGTATDKQCQLENWKKIGGPYDKPEDAPLQHPDPTNRVSKVTGPVMKIAVQQSTDLMSWTTVYEDTCDTEDFAYLPPTNTAAMFRLSVGAP